MGTEGMPAEGDLLPDVTTAKKEKVDRKAGEFGWRGWASVVILCFVNTLNYVDRYSIAGIPFEVQTYFGLNDAQMGLLQTLYIVPYFVAAPVFGYWGDRINRKFITVSGVVIWSASVFGSSYIHYNSAWIMYLSRALIGVGESCFYLVAPSIIADLFVGSKRSIALMLFFMTNSLGFAIGIFYSPRVMGYLKEHTVNATQFHLFYHDGQPKPARLKNYQMEWQWILFWTPFLGLVGASLLIWPMVEPKRGASEGLKNLRSPGVLKDIKALLCNKTYMLIIPAYSFTWFATGATAWWGTKLALLGYDKHTHKYGMEFIASFTENGESVGLGLIFSVGLAGIFGLFLGSLVSTIWRRSNPLADPLLCAFFKVLSMPTYFVAFTLLEVSIPLFWVAITLHVIFNTAVYAVTSDITMYVNPPQRRVAAKSWIMFVCHVFGDGPSPYIIGAISDYYCGDLCDYDKHPMHKYSRAIRSRHFDALRNALYFAVVGLAISALFYYAAVFTVAQDRAAAQEEARALQAHNCNNKNNNNDCGKKTD